MNKDQLAQMIDQTLLSQNATYEQTESFCREALAYGFASVCINPVYIPLAAKILSGSKTKVCTVIDFPLGAGGTQLKKTDAVNAVKAGADEVDLVVDLAGLNASNDINKSSEGGASDTSENAPSGNINEEENADTTNI